MGCISCMVIFRYYISHGYPTYHNIQLPYAYFMTCSIFSQILSIQLWFDPDGEVWGIAGCWKLKQYFTFAVFIVTTSPTLVGLKRSYKMRYPHARAWIQWSLFITILLKKIYIYIYIHHTYTYYCEGMKVYLVSARGYNQRHAITRTNAGIVLIQPQEQNSVIF